MDNFILLHSMMASAAAANAADEKFKAYFNNPFSRNVMNIEYSSLGDFQGKGYLAGNSEQHFRKSIELGFDGLKADMRLTSDGEIILCHDAGYTFDDDGRIAHFNSGNFVPIREMTFEKAASLEFADVFEGRRLHPCTLDTMLALCQNYGMVPYLTLRHEPWQPETAKRMVELILAHDVQRRTIINLFPGSKKTIDCVSALLPGLEYCFTGLPNQPLSAELIDSSAAEGYKLICICRQELASITPEICHYAASKGIHVWTWGANTIEDCKEDISRGVTGFQMVNRMATNSVIADILKS